MLEGVEIRKAKKGDLSSLAILYLEVYTQFDAGEKWTKKAAYNLLFHLFERCPELGFVAEKNGVLVGGFFAGVKPWCDGMHMVDGELFVKSGLQRKGVGKSLLKAAFDECASLGISYVDAVTFRNEVGLLSWYKKLGFKEVDNLCLISADIKELRKNTIKNA